MGNNFRKVTYEDWKREGEERFGPAMRDWKFKCPVCGHVQGFKDFLALGVPEEEARSVTGFSCIGRWMDKARDAFEEGEGPCNYAGGGLFALNPVTVHVPEGHDDYTVFEFADA